jgi:hypothetical protein
MAAWLGRLATWIMIVNCPWAGFELRLHPLGQVGPRNKTLLFFAPRTRTDSDFRLAPGSFTKLEYLILNHHTRNAPF